MKTHLLAIRMAVLFPLVAGACATFAPRPALGGGRATPVGHPQAAPATDTTAEKMLVYQRAVGGWPKAVDGAKVDYRRPLSADRRRLVLADQNRPDATIDNDATSREINYLAGAYTKTNNPAYRAAAEKGIRYLLQMQYPNGGFPQFYPDLGLYRHQITYNDNAMIQALTVLRNVAARKGPFQRLDPALVPLAQAAEARGIDCILKTQVVRNGHLTAWCAQHDEKTLQPAKARNFELASLSGAESVGIVEFLMGIEQPSAAVKAAVEGAVAWFEKVKLADVAVQNVVAPQEQSGRDRVLVAQPGAVLWARFYELGTDRPIYVGRDSRVHYQLAEIENERRVGYNYNGTWPARLLANDYPAWHRRVYGK